MLFGKPASTLPDHALVSGQSSGPSRGRAGAQL
jgi:hypothetical protein